MPRWDWLLAGALMVVAAAWWISILTREPSEASRLHEAYRQQCPEYAVAYRQAYEGVGLDEAPPDSAALDKLEEWRLGDVEAVRCRLMLEQAGSATMDDVLERRDASSAEIALSRSGRDRQIFALRYYLWRRTGEGLYELEALARSMAREDVDSAVTLWMFRQGAAPTPLLDETGRIAPDDPGYRFVQMARPNGSER